MKSNFYNTINNTINQTVRQLSAEFSQSTGRPLQYRRMSQAGSVPSSRPQRAADKPMQETGKSKMVPEDISEGPQSTNEEVSSPIYAGEIGKEESFLTLDHDSVLKGLIFSEILGKPKCKRTGR